MTEKAKVSEADYPTLTDDGVAVIWVVDEETLKVKTLWVRLSGFSNIMEFDDEKWWDENGEDSHALRLKRTDGNLYFHIYEGGHWEYGDRDESVDFPCEESGFYWTMNRDDAEQWIAGQKTTKEHVARDDRSDALRSASKDGLMSILTAFGKFVTHDSYGEVGTGVDWTEYASRFVRRS